MSQEVVPINQTVKNSPKFVLSDLLTRIEDVEAIAIGVIYKDGDCELLSTNMKQSHFAWLIARFQAQLNNWIGEED